MKTEYRTYTIEPDQRNPYAQKPEWMYYLTSQGVQHDADQDGEDLRYCGNCEWADTLEDAQIAIDDLIIEEQENEIEALNSKVKTLTHEIEQLIFKAENECLDYSSLEHARKLIFEPK